MRLSTSAVGQLIGFPENLCNAGVSGDAMNKMRGQYEINVKAMRQTMVTCGDVISEKQYEMCEGTAN